MLFRQARKLNIDVLTFSQFVLLQESRPFLANVIPGVPKIQKNVSKALGLKAKPKAKKFNGTQKPKAKKKTKPLFKPKRIRPISAMIGSAIRSSLIPKTPKVPA